MSALAEAIVAVLAALVAVLAWGAVLLLVAA